MQILDQRVGELVVRRESVIVLRRDGRAKDLVSSDVAEIVFLKNACVLPAGNERTPLLLEDCDIQCSARNLWAYELAHENAQRH
jgi:hypothetical protein